LKTDPEYQKFINVSDTTDCASNAWLGTNKIRDCLCCIILNGWMFCYSASCVQCGHEGTCVALELAQTKVYDFVLHFMTCY